MSAGMSEAGGKILRSCHALHRRLAATRPKSYNGKWDRRAGPHVPESVLIVGAGHIAADSSR